MKKIFALALAASMVASMAAVSFAAVGPTATGSDGDPTMKYDTKAYFPVVDAYGPLTYDADDKALDSGVVEYGETAYYILVEGQVSGTLSKDNNGDAVTSYTEALVTESETVSSLKVKASWEEGKGLVKDISIVKKKVSNDATSDTAYTDEDGNPYKSINTLLGDDFGYVADKYYYFIAIDTTSSTSTSDADIIGTLTLSKSKHPKVDDLDLDIALNVGWENNYNDYSDLNVTSSTVSGLKAETYYAMKFNYDDEVDIEFDDDSIFTVDVSGQSKLLVYFDTKFNSKIAAKYPLAEFNFWNGNGAKFNRVGEMFIPVKEDYAQFLYQLNADGTLSEVPGAEYDKYDEGFYFNTRVLGTYVISDMELDLQPAVTTPTTPTTPTPPPAVTNPSTGAAV